MPKKSRPIGGHGHIKRLSGFAHWWWLFWEPSESGLRGNSNERASWYVVYETKYDGTVPAREAQRSAALPYGTAVNMAEMFQGHIKRVR